MMGTECTHPHAGQGIVAPALAVSISSVRPQVHGIRTIMCWSRNVRANRAACPGACGSGYREGLN
jgi:hypothetical protein